MSWSVSHVGTPPEIVEKLQAQSAALTGQSKVEFDDALPHLVGLVNQNFRAERAGGPAPRLSLSAYGSGYADGDGQVSRSCAARVEAAPPNAAA